MPNHTANGRFGIPKALQNLLNLLCAAHRA